ncbi:MAG: ABZJ_00895 family protein [Paracoccaceae bacterium]
MTKNSAEHATPVDGIPARMLRYGGMHLITLGGVVALDWVLLRYLNIDVPPVVRTIVPPIVAAQAEGMWLARAGHPVASGRAYWRAAVRMTAVAAGIGLAQVLWLFLTEPQVVRLMMDVPGFSLGLILAITLCLNRFSLSQGHRTEHKNQAAKQAKDDLS